LVAPLRIFFLVVSTVSQGKITELLLMVKGSLPGANDVTDQGTKTRNGHRFLKVNFQLIRQLILEKLVISFIGFQPKTVKFSVVDGATKNLRAIIFKSNSNELEEIVVTSSNFAKDRKNTCCRFYY
jgi:hypothetical protein